MNNCTQCKHHIILADPDPEDWFNNNDVKAVCKLNNRKITESCRPYNIQKECKTPDWCPLKEYNVKNTIKIEKQLLDLK